MNESEDETMGPMLYVIMIRSWKTLKTIQEP